MADSDMSCYVARLRDTPHICLRQKQQGVHMRDNRPRGCIMKALPSWQDDLGQYPELTHGSSFNLRLRFVMVTNGHLGG